MILVALGANLPSRYGAPAQTLQAARAALEAAGIAVVASSRIWLTAPVPFDPDQDWYHNAVVQVETDLKPRDLLLKLQQIEEEFGRVRTVKNAPRLLDLDVIAYHDEKIMEDDTLIVPHPRMQERLFVLKPLEDIAQAWTHPISGQTLSDMIHDLGDGQKAEALENGWQTQQEIRA